MKVTVLGSGAWGMGLAHVLQENAHSVYVWSIEQEVIDLFNQKQEHPCFPHVSFDSSIVLTDDITEAVEEAEFIVIAIPVPHIRSVLSEHAALLKGKVLVSASKGIEQITGLFVSEIITETLGSETPVAILSGPNLAQDIVKNMPAATSIACPQRLQPLLRSTLSTPSFHVSFTEDIITVQVGGALKNVFAILTGVASGLEYSLSSTASLLTASLLEIKEFAKFKGISSPSVNSFAGVGDLILTALSPHSRNHRFGLLIGQGTSPTEALNAVGTVEGFHTVFSLNNINGFQNMPLAQATFEIVHDMSPPQPIIQKIFKTLTHA